MTRPDRLTVEELNPITFPLVNRFFKENGHKGKARGDERVWVVRDQQGDILAGLRASQKPAGYLLRSVWVGNHVRRQGIGSLLLTATLSDLKSETCWCYPYPHLETFYMTAGFVFPVIESVPADIMEPYQRYQQQGNDFLLMACFPE